MPNYQPSVSYTSLENTLYHPIIHDKVMHHTLKEALGHLERLSASLSRRRLSRDEIGAVNVFVMYSRTGLFSNMCIRVECTSNLRRSDDLGSDVRRVLNLLHVLVVILLHLVAQTLVPSPPQPSSIPFPKNPRGAA